MSYTPEALEQIQSAHQRLARFLGRNGQANFAQFGVREGQGEEVLGQYKEAIEERERLYKTPITGGLWRFLDIFSFRQLAVEGPLFYIGVTYKALEEIAKQSPLRMLHAHFKTTSINCYSICPELPVPFNPDSIFTMVRTEDWRRKRTADFPIVIDSPNWEQVELPDLPGKKFHARMILLPPGPRLANSGWYFYPDQAGDTLPVGDLESAALTWLNRLPRSLGQKQKVKAV